MRKERITDPVREPAYKSIFVCFGGPAVSQADSLIRISPGYECWNVKASNLDTFIENITAKIPPINDNVLNHYRAPDGDARLEYGIRPQEYERGSWGLLLPEPVPEALGGYAETMFLLNLYSPQFLYPTFYVTDFGIHRPQQPLTRQLVFHGQNQSQRFARESFVRFHKALMPESAYSVWQAPRVARWNEEDWRLFIACMLFSEQRQYENSKVVFGWQRESSDLATILEALFTAEHNENTEIIYRLKKRVAVLLAAHVPGIEDAIRELYKQRSSFVHGSFFQSLKKKMKVQNGFAELPSPPFQFLYSQKENVRLALIAYLYLDKARRLNSADFKCESVLQLLERAIIDVKVRGLIEAHTAEILGLL